MIGPNWRPTLLLAYLGAKMIDLLAGTPTQTISLAKWNLTDKWKVDELAVASFAIQYKMSLTFVLLSDTYSSKSACFIDNISGIKLRGASFLMHQVYDDEMTFKLVAAASNVSGLPVEVCLEEFGKHFLVYCQKNGYDQILRVLGSNLYDFLTNLDNLHDHLASIYPGMRAPSFRVTRHLNTNQPHRNSGDSSSSTESRQQQLQQASLPTNDELHRENATCSLADGNSMYLHYYSERAGLSPIVKGLVMAVAKEFFQTDILVAECQLLKPTSVDDHVVLKIDRRQIEPTAAEPKEPQRQRTSTIDLEEPLKRAEEAANKFTCDNTGNDKPRLNSNLFDSLSTSAKDSMVSSEMMMQTFPFHVIFDRRFRLVQVGKSLLRATSRHWQRHQQSAVRFNDLFSIIRPKIEFTFDAIADHTNQVFVVRTRPQVLNADALRCQSEPMTRVAVAHATIPPTGCPMDRLALAARKRRSELAPPEEQEPPPPPSEQQLVESSNDEPAAGEYLSLRLKGQMIILLGGELCLFLCSPRVDHLDQLMECGIRMSDFALHDRARELMLMSHTHKEDRETVKKLDQATNDLKKMDAKLRMENERTNEVLHNIFPAKIAALLSHGHKVESESFDSVTCLYSDIIGFTKMCGSENVRPIDIVRLLNTLYLQFDNLTNIHQVFKVETIGDAYVVVGGLPEPAQDHADRCVKMGLDMVKVIATVRSPADKEPIQMRIGIHSGPVMAGIVGIRVPRYSLFGNTTTLANQLETNGVGGKIHISDFTLKSLIKRDKFVVEDNPNELAGFPFSPTYFVTNYIGDQQETRDHEKILEEQLIKDLQLMGNEVELVDDLQMDQLAGIADQQAVASTSLEALAASAPILAAPTWRGAAEEPDATAREATSIPKSPGPGRRTLSESLAAAADNFDGSQQQLQQFDRLILMDIEERKNGHKQVQQMSARLSAQIMGEALEQATARMKVADRKPSAVELLLGEQTDLELVLRATSRRQRAAACTLCGQVAPSGAAQGDVIRVRVDSGLLPPSSSSDCASCSAKDSKLDLQLTRPRLGQLLEWLAGGCTQPPDCTVTDKGGQQSGGSTLSTGSSSKLTSQPVKSATPINGAADRLGLERLLEELRLERRKLEAQVERLSQQLTSAPSPIHLTAIGPAPPANCLNNRPPSQVASSGADQPAGPLRSPGRSQVPAQPRSLLSSNIQRMKRMDTLKLRKLKKQQQQQAESGSPLEPNGNSSADSSSSRPRDSRSGCSPVLLEEEPEQEEQRPAEAHAGERVAPSLVVGEQHPPSLVSPDTPTQADPPPTPKTYKIGNYNYQALRHSLAGLLGEHSGGGLPMTNNSREGTTVSSAAQQSAQKPPQAQPPTGKRRFNLNPFAGMSSPFGSSAKDHPAQGAPPKRGGSCSCLRTSASNQSVQSHESP